MSWKGAKKRKEINLKTGQNLKRIRKQQGLMQIDVAVATNLNSNYISRIETGKARITMSLLLQLVKGLGITSGDLLEQNA